jgi:hypothetical protein
MSDEIQQLRDDIAFVRSMVEDDGSVLRASAIGLLVAGIVFGLAALRAFALDSGWLRWPEALRPLLSWDAPLLFFLVLLPVLAISSAGARPSFATISAASRAVWASWAAVGIGYAVAAASLSIAGLHGASAVLFAFWGSGWLSAAAAYRRRRHLLISLGCYLSAITAGFLEGTPREHLLMALAFWALVALPGLMILREVRARPPHRLWPDSI